MASRFCFIYVVCCFVFVLVLAVYLQQANHRVFYALCVRQNQRRQLERQLWHKQLQLESLINPAAVSERLDPEDG